MWPRLRASAVTEFALMVPLLMAGMMGIITFSLAMFGQQLAANAAAHAARVAALTQTNRDGAALTAAQTSLDVLPLSRGWRVAICDGEIASSCELYSADLGATGRVEVYWESPNFVGPLLPGLADDPLQGTAAATFRNEGW